MPRPKTPPKAPITPTPITRDPRRREGPQSPNSDNPMTVDEARKLAATMRASGNGLELFASVDRDERGDRITFVGGRYGAHSLSVNVTSEERARIHWRGYCEANGIMLPPVESRQQPTSQIVPDARVRFRSGSSSNGWRVGVVQRVTATRCLIAFRYDYQRGKGAQHATWRKLSEVVLVSLLWTV
jgi:hypothetical protein